MRPLLSLLLMLVVLVPGIAPAGVVVSTGHGAHACCRTMHAAPSHDGCPQPAASTMSCCAPAPDRGSDTQGPPAGTTAAHQPHFTLLKGHAAHVPGAPALAGASVAHAFESARLKLPRDPLYLRHTVLIV